jgi:hypothetical protein
MRALDGAVKQAQFVLRGCISLIGDLAPPEYCLCEVAWEGMAIKTRRIIAATSDRYRAEPLKLNRSSCDCPGEEPYPSLGAGFIWYNLNHGTWTDVLGCGSPATALTADFYIVH